MTVLLGVDFGTSNTVAVLRFPDGRSRPLLFDGSPIMPSAVFAEERALLIGRDAEHSARIRPERFEPNPKRRIDDGTVRLGGQEVEVADLFAAVLARVLTEANRIAGGTGIAGGTDIEVTLTHPAGWGAERTGVLVEAARRAGMRTPRLVPEPVAAAAYYLGALNLTVPVGGSIVIYDFGAGTFDASVVRREPGGFAVLASEGLNDAGGLDIDQAIVGYLGAIIVTRDPAAWQRLEQPETDNDRRAQRLFREDVRAAKEILSRTASTYVHVPIIDDSLPIGREQLETLARPVLDRTVAATRQVIRRAGLTSQPAAIFLVGGSSRIPLAATLLHRELGMSPSAVEQPELVVADGSVHAAAVTVAPPANAPVSAVPVSGTPISGAPGSGTPASAPRAPVPRASAPRAPVPRASALRASALRCPRRGSPIPAAYRRPSPPPTSRCGLPTRRLPDRRLATQPRPTPRARRQPRATPDPRPPRRATRPAHRQPRATRAARHRRRTTPEPRHRPRATRAARPASRGSCPASPATRPTGRGSPATRRALHPPRRAFRPAGHPRSRATRAARHSSSPATPAHHRPRASRPHPETSRPDTSSSETSRREASRPGGRRSDRRHPRRAAGGGP